MNLKLRLSNYIIRYAPSEKKLREYLSRKNHTWNFYELLNELGYQESMMCVLWVRSFMAWSKWEREILEKLMKKWFPKELIRNILDDTQEELYDWEIHRSNIESSIEGMLKKWKSKRAIFIKMREKYPYFLENITLLLETKEDNFWLKNEIEKYQKKYDISDYKQRSQFFSALERKGFGYKTVLHYLEEKDSTNENS